jgi:diadenosine tetraphosphate (Ap4A) HIT family hydrolase
MAFMIDEPSADAGPVANSEVLADSHLHAHIVPRYADDPRPGWPFPFPEEDPPSMSQQVMNEDIAMLKREVSAKG